MSLSNKWSYLFHSIMLLLQDRITIIFTVTFKINHIAFTIKISFEGQFNWKFNKIAPWAYVIDICIFHRLRLGDMIIFYMTLSHKHKHNFSILWNFGLRDIAFRVLCLPCNSHRSKWPKTICRWNMDESISPTYGMSIVVMSYGQYVKSYVWNSTSGCVIWMSW